MSSVKSTVSDRNNERWLVTEKHRLRMNFLYWEKSHTGGAVFSRGNHAYAFWNLGNWPYVEQDSEYVFLDVGEEVYFDPSKQHYTIAKIIRENVQVPNQEPATYIKWIHFILEPITRDAKKEGAETNE